MINFSFGVINLCPRLLRLSLTGSLGSVRYAKRQNVPIPRLRYPKWYVKQDRVKYNEELTPENAAFIKEIIHEKYGPPAVISGIPSYEVSPLKTETFAKGEWFPGCRRSGLIAKKIGVIPQWTADGTMMLVTLLQVIDNHVISYTPPEEFKPMRRINPKKRRMDGKLGGLLVGALSSDPQQFTKEYCGLFNKVGLMPKKILTRFPIHPAAAITPGTPLTAAHFRVGDYVDVSSQTKYRGFQGVMKRWGFHGMPATHGVTKTHRRPGNIGSGGTKARVMPGTKMPGHMGHKLRTLRGLKIWRINYKYNVLYVSGCAVPGITNCLVYVHDSLLFHRRFKEKGPEFPTYFPEDHEEPLPEEVCDPELFDFHKPTITYEVKEVKK